MEKKRGSGYIGLYRVMKGHILVENTGKEKRFCTASLLCLCIPLPQDAPFVW